MKTNIYPPPIYRLDKINNYIKAKLDDYLRDSKEMSKGAFEKTIFMRMFFENEIEQSKILLSEVGQNKRDKNLDPYSMSLARSIYGYAKDYELIHLEKEFFKFYIISLEKHLEVLLNSLNKIQPEAVKTDEKFKTENLFKVGLLFATGEMNKYFTIKGNNEIVANNGLSPLKIANELQNPSFEKWILASKNNYSSDNPNGNKNIFNNLDMMTKIINHCKAEKTEIDPYFMSRLPIE